MTKGIPLRRSLALFWMVLFLLFQAGLGVHVHNCLHCGPQQTAVCVPTQSCHDCDDCHNSQDCRSCDDRNSQDCHSCHSCFILLKLSDYFPSETWHPMPLFSHDGLHQPIHIFEIQPVLAAQAFPEKAKGNPPSKAGNRRFIRFCHQITLYA